jgi:hypothetical protein
LALFSHQVSPAASKKRRADSGEKAASGEFELLTAVCSPPPARRWAHLTALSADRRRLPDLMAGGCLAFSHFLIPAH